MNQSFFDDASQIGITEWPNPVISVPASVFEQILPTSESMLEEGAMGAYEDQMTDFLSKEDELLNLLRKNYVFDPSNSVRSFLKDHRFLIEILSEAVAELKRSFGKDVILQLQVFEDTGTPATIYGIVIWHDGLQSARAALRSFDETWWIVNSRRTSGRIIFDYQLA